ncbi:MAG: hypothetical protein ALECFALPRED_007495 [Alectoria fallacina]|uniref:Uncharacterized protein n=1 Tax=Alectoria fallacina TaxID=1903189 RepID=A0A8H3J0C7_9LECA|nr:MAG: hypothetical protein ALECFALPRED_007495 [Alectoria fallacina]
MPLTTSLSLSTPLSLLDVSVSPTSHPFVPTQNISTTTTAALTTWPHAPFDIPIPHLDIPTTLSVVDTGSIQSGDDKKWLLAAIDYQQSVYSMEGDQPKKFNIWNDEWRFYMEPGQRPMTMAMAVSVLQLYKGLVEAYGMAPMAFVVRVGEDVRGFYWVTVKGTGAGVDAV